MVSAGRVQLDELDYLRLAALRGKVHAAVLQGNAEVEQARGVAQQRIAGAEEALRAALRNLGPKYRDLSMTTEYTFDDQQHQLVPKM